MMRGYWWSAGFSLAGLVLVVGVYGCLRYALPEQAKDSIGLLYGLVGLGPYVFAAYGSGAAPLGSRSRVVTLACGIVVCLVGTYLLWIAVDDATHIRAMRDAGRDHGMPGTLFAVLFLVPCQYAASLVSAVVGGISHDFGQS